MRLVALIALALALPAAAAADRGRDLYLSGCAQCHGADLRGIDRDAKVGAGDIRARGPSLRGVGARAADLYLRTGYMPLDDPREQPERSRPSYSERDVRALVGFVASFGGPGVPDVDPERGSTSTGLQVFTEHCAGCHQIVGEGGIVTGAKVPSLADATPREIAEAVRVGPYVMPRFSEHDISPRELDSLVRYVLYARDPQDRGGWSLGRLGPIPEGLVAWLVAGVALLLVARVIGERLE